MQETKRKKGLLNSSKQEDTVYDILKQVFPDIVRQYKSEKYPFYCDFYIPSLDLYIEVNFNWTHGKHLFNPNNEEDIKTLNIWHNKAKQSNFFKNAIITWTVRDVNKVEYIEKNNLNFIIFYSLKEFYEWLQNKTIATINFN